MRARQISFLADGDKLSISAYINCSERRTAFDTLDGMIAFVGKA
jgi:hypothetical protein